MAYLPLEDLSKELKNNDLDKDDLPMQRTLWMNGDLHSYKLTFCVFLNPI